MDDSIKIKGARVNNLKNVSLEIPRNKFVVVTGVSGSGKSSLAFDTLYAEGQRRYVESLNTYARQFLGRMNKPECDFIEGIPPSIAIEQKVIARNPRSTVGTSTEIYDYLRMLFARVGHTFSPVSGVEVKKQSVEDVVDCMLAHKEGTRFLLLSPLRVHEGRTREQQLDIYAKEGFSRVEVDGELQTLPLSMTLPADAEVNLVIDRLMVYYRDPEAGNCFKEYIKRSFLLGKPISIIRAGQEPIPATAVGLDRDYALIVRLEDGSMQKINSGEVSVRATEL